MPRPSARAELREVRSDLRRCSWKLRSIAIRQAARSAFDLPRLGTGPLERITVSLVLAGLFGFMTLGASHLQSMETKYRLALAGAAFATVLLTSAVLVIWGRDDVALQRQKAALQDEVLALAERKGEIEYSLQESEDRAVQRRERDLPETKRCPYCREMIPIRALKCRYCGEILDEELAEARRVPAFNPGIAAVLSFLIPGLGQLYKSQVLAGLLWFMLVESAYLTCLMGTYCCCGLGLFGLPIALILHVVCLFDAASGR